MLDIIILTFLATFSLPIEATHSAGENVGLKRVGSARQNGQQQAPSWSLTGQMKRNGSMGSSSRSSSQLDEAVKKPTTPPTLGELMAAEGNRTDGNISSSSSNNNNNTFKEHNDAMKPAPTPTIGQLMQSAKTGTSRVSGSGKFSQLNDVMKSNTPTIGQLMQNAKNGTSSASGSGKFNHLHEETKKPIAQQSVQNAKIDMSSTTGTNKQLNDAKKKPTPQQSVQNAKIDMSSTTSTNSKQLNDAKKKPTPQQSVQNAKTGQLNSSSAKPRQSLPYHSISTPSSPIVQGYQPHLISLNACMPRKYREMMFRSNSANYKNNASRNSLTKCSTYPHGCDTLGNTSRMIEDEAQKLKNKDPKLSPKSIKQFFTKMFRIKSDENLSESATTTTITEEKPKKAKEEKQPAEKLKKKVTLSNIDAKEDLTVFFGAEKLKKKVTLSNRKELKKFFDAVDAKEARKLHQSDHQFPGEASLRFSQSAEIAAKVSVEEELPGEASFRFSSSPDALKKIREHSDDEYSDKASFGFPSPDIITPPMTPERWFKKNEERKSGIAVKN